LRCDPFDFLLAQLKRPLEIQPLLQDQEEHYPIPMPRAKKPPQLSAKERALLNRLDRLSEEEIKRLTTREIFAYFKLIDRVDSRTDIRRMVERAKWRHK
jgi:hypothetical protein